MRAEREPLGRTDHEPRRAEHGPGQAPCRQAAPAGHDRAAGGQ
ncbi:hypothetical protein ACFPRL_27625 [Pseudoclavibacter helvolus]